MLSFDPAKDQLQEDKEFTGSIFEKLELSKYLCPTCNAHLKDTTTGLICLNGCHLPAHWQKRFSNLMEQTKKENEK